ncbi:hypothetical protein MFLAVUS_005846 [Mucor flavus]|uniref:WWE domain-containing protein n=1 Tax=Mucor flavus TaxID=439312 RepID=A0ABP9YZW3_9FUNG
MGSVQWVYANGCNWITLDGSAQNHIEALWKQNTSAWVSCQAFPSSAVYVDIAQMALFCNGFAYTIARRRN